jgi:hypothetical protein
MALGLLLCAACATAQAQDWRTCAALADDGERLSCYDSYAALLAEQGETAATEAFGLPPSTPAETPDLIEARVTGVRWSVHGKLLIWLDNGQSWKQIDTRTSFRLALDERVIIKRGWLGSYKLSRDGYNTQIKVRRTE